MNTQEKIDAGFDVRNIEKIMQEQAKNKKIQNDNKEKKKDYGNKYLQNRRSISVEETIAERLEAIQKKREMKTKGELFTYLANLEEKVDPAFNTTYRCKTCGEEVKDIPKHINVNKFTHRDLCIDSSCKGYIAIKSEIALNDNGTVISKKDMPNGTTTTSDKNDVQTDTKTKTQREIDEEDWKMKELPESAIRVLRIDRGYEKIYDFEEDFE